MNNFSKIKHTVLLALFIALIPAPAHAGFMDNAWSFIKQNTATIATAAVGLLCCGLVWWKKNNDLEQLRATKAAKPSANAKAIADKSTPKLSTGAKAMPVSISDKDDTVAKLTATMDEQRKRELEQLTASKDAEKESAIKQLKAAKDVEKTHALKTFVTQAEVQLKEQLDKSLDQEKAKIEGSVTALSQKMQKLRSSADQLKTRYTALQLKHKALLNQPLEIREVTEFLKKAEEICNRAEKATAHHGEKQFASTLDALKEALAHIQSRLHTLFQISSNKVNYSTVYSYDTGPLYEYLELTPLVAAMMAPEAIRLIIEQRCGQTVNPIKAAMLAIFENEFSKRHFDLSLKGDQHLSSWTELIKARQAKISGLHSKVTSLLTTISAALKANERLGHSKQTHDKASHSGSGATAGKNPNATAAKSATAQSINPDSLTTK
jgi:hypothetical protein